jgi:hypothetical protein
VAVAYTFVMLSKPERRAIAQEQVALRERLLFNQQLDAARLTAQSLPTTAQDTEITRLQGEIATTIAEAQKLT